MRAIIARNERVLVTSYTHSAVDHLLSKLSEAGVSPSITIRLGSATSVQPALHPYMLCSASSNNSSSSCSSSSSSNSRAAGDVVRKKTIADVRARCESARLVCCTVLTAPRNVVLKCLQIDWCIVDEAGQISQPAALGALLHSRRFVLVGDEYQLPPLVVSSEARSGGMDESLFKRLAEAHPPSVSCLSAQYRMNEDIMSLCNVLIYEHRMCCANAAIANSRLILPKLHALPRPQHAQVLLVLPPPRATVPTPLRTDWLFRCIDPRSSLLFSSLYFSLLPNNSSFDINVFILLPVDILCIARLSCSSIWTIFLLYALRSRHLLPLIIVAEGEAALRVLSRACISIRSRLGL